MTKGSTERQSPQGLGPPAADIDVCICTYRRLSLTATLRSVAAQTLGAAVRLRIIVADNDVEPSARGLVLAEAEALGLTIDYRHAPSRNISLARNACLEASTAPLVAFIDDDEVADSQWLAALTEALDETTDVVFGPVVAVYDPAFPAWIAEADLHSMAPVTLANGEIVTGYTSNCLIRRRAFEGQDFDLELGRSGGEDTEYFARLHALGSRLSYAPQAIVREPVAPGRAQLRWLWQRSFRAGQTHARVKFKQPLAAVNGLLSASAKAAFCHAAALAQLRSRVGWRRNLVRGALHLGAVSRILGLADLKLY